VQALLSIAGLMELLPREAKGREMETAEIAGTLQEHVLKEKQLKIVFKAKCESSGE